GLITVRGQVTLVAKYNTFDGNDDLSLGYAVTNTTEATGNQTYEYNTFLHCPAACLTFGQTGNFKIHYNYVQGIDELSNPSCNPACSHGDWFIINNFTMAAITETLNASFDTVYLDSTNGSNMSTLCYFAFAGPPYPAPTFSGSCRNETYIARAGYNVGGTAVRVEPQGTAQGPFTIANNYIDPADFAGGAGLVILANGSDGTSSSVTCTGNINMLNGSTVTPSNGQTNEGRSFMTCR
ncbi:MAG: hypothetical protein WBW81_03565, partial [Methylocella sp.]